MLPSAQPEFQRYHLTQEAERGKGTTHRFPIGVVHGRDDAADDDEAPGLVQVIPGSLWGKHKEKGGEGFSGI